MNDQDKEREIMKSKAIDFMNEWKDMPIETDKDIYKFWSELW